MIGRWRKRLRVRSGSPFTSSGPRRWQTTTMPRPRPTSRSSCPRTRSARPFTACATRLTTRRANDILRAAGLTPAPLDDPGVMKDLIKAIEGKPLSPVLVLSGRKGSDIADGFHRVSLVYRLDPYSVVPLKLG